MHQAETYCGKVHELGGRLTCPECTKIVGYAEKTGNNLVPQKALVKTPVFLVSRTNSKTGTKFWGCPNFPRCRVTVSIRSRRKTIYEPSHWDSSDEALYGFPDLYGN